MAVGLVSFQKRMREIPQEVRASVAPSLEQAAEKMADTMRTLAPHQTGALIDSIAVTGPGESTPAYSQPGGSSLVPENAVKITVGNSAVRYAHLVEFGTANAPAQPFFWPGFRLSRGTAEKIIKRAILKAIRGVK